MTTAASSPDRPMMAGPPVMSPPRGEKRAPPQSASGAMNHNNGAPPLSDNGLHSNGTTGGSSSNPTPLDAAADLMQTLDSALAEMSSYVKEAADDAHDARQNARAASDIARRYGSRSRTTITPATAPPTQQPASTSSPPRTTTVSPPKPDIPSTSAPATKVAPGPPPVGGFWQQALQKPPNGNAGDSHTKPTTPTESSAHAQSTLKPTTTTTTTAKTPAPKFFNPVQFQTSAKTEVPEMEDTNMTEEDVSPIPEVGVLPELIVNPSLEEPQLEPDMELVEEPDVEPTDQTQQEEEPEREREQWQPEMSSQNHLSPSLPTPVVPAVSFNENTINNDAFDAVEITTPSGKKRKNFENGKGNVYFAENENVPDSSLSVSSRKIAHSHAEDVLSMSLELERAKQALEAERKSHAETRRLLTESRTRTSTLECEHQKVLGDMEAVRAVGERDSNGLRTELRRSTIRVKAAEEDAQLALELAKDCAEAKQQVEIWLERALNEIQALRGQLAAGTPTRHSEQQRTPVVKFSDHVEISEPAASTPSAPVASFDEDDDAAGSHDPLVSPPLSMNQQNPKSPQEKAMVSAGRDLLRRALTSTDTDGSGMASPARMSPERRRRLSERLSFLDTISNNDDDNRRSKSSSSGRSSSDVGHATRAHITLRNVTKLLRESGVRLDLGGRWWTSSSTTALVRTSIPMEDVHVTSQDLEAMARSYCQSVEAKMGRQLEDNRGLQTLCNYLERKVVPIKMGTADEEIEECLAEMEAV